MISVPIGIDVVNTQTNVLLARCTKPFHRYLLAEGGQGGSAETDYWLGFSDVHESLAQISPIFIGN